MTEFVPLQDFWCAELKSYFVKGLIYRITEINLKFITQWMAQGRVRLNNVNARVRGRATSS